MYEAAQWQMLQAVHSGVRVHDADQVRSWRSVSSAAAVLCAGLCAQRLLRLRFAQLRAHLTVKSLQGL